MFASSAEVEAQWAVVERLLQERPEPLPYAPGSSGPGPAGDLIGRDGRSWRAIA